MKTSLFLIVGGLSSLIAVAATAQTSSGGAPSGGAMRPVSPPPNPSVGALPPGLQNRQQVPRPQYPAQFPPPLASGTNQFNQFTTNQFDLSTNSTSLTNQIGQTNGTNLTIQDQAVTATDQALLVRIRETVQTVTQAQGSSWMPVHFNVNNGVVTILGTVQSPAQQQQIAGLVQQIPGVNGVLNQSTVGTVGQLSTVQGQSLALRVRQAVLPQIQVGGNPVPINFSVQQEGVVTITGVVPTLAQKHQIAALVRQVPGVVQIDDRIAVNPASRGGLNGATGFGQSGFPQTNSFGLGSVGFSNSSFLNTNLSPTGRTNSLILPPGLQNRSVLPPGLQNREPLPPGLLNRTNSGAQ